MVEIVELSVNIRLSLVSQFPTISRFLTLASDLAKSAFICTKMKRNKRLLHHKLKRSQVLWYIPAGGIEGSLCVDGNLWQRAILASQVCGSWVKNEFIFLNNVLSLRNKCTLLHQ